MRIKSFEIIISLTMITTSILSLNSDQSYFKGFPVYHWVEYVILAVGFLLPICAWLLRTSKKDVTAEQEKNKMTCVSLFALNAKRPRRSLKYETKCALNVISKWNRLTDFMTAILK